jgi:hypothetical protein
VKSKNVKTPILVTGAHRSGTTWVGKILAASPEVGYISEPLNKLHRPGVMGEPVEYWYPYICEENESRYLAALGETIHFEYHFLDELRSLRSIKDVGRMGRDVGRFMNGRLRDARVLLKDPFAVFSVPWFARSLGCQVVIVVRHPAAFVSSLKRLDWSFDFRDLLDQPFLMRDHLEPFLAEMENVPMDVVGQGCLLWKMIYSVVDGYRTSGLDLQVVRHEDLSRQPIEGFRDLFFVLGLGFSPKVQRTLLNSSQRGNPGELSKRRVHAVKLDSQVNLSNWKRRLKDDEIDRIRKLTIDVASLYYSEKSWE